MDCRFTDIICEVEGFTAPEVRRIQILEEVVRSQMYDQHVSNEVATDLYIEEVAADLYTKIYEGYDEE